MTVSKAARRKELLRKILNAPFDVLAKSALKIKTKSGKLVPLEFNDAQKHIDAECEDQLRRIGKVRKALLKGRQQGGSTYVEGRFFVKLSRNRGRNVFVLSHEAKTTGKLMDMVRRYLENFPRAIRPKLSTDSMSLGLVFPKLDASYEMGTAGNAQTGRGHTIFYLHGSEVAFWPNGEEILSGLLQAVPDELESEVILESTANGVGGVFYQYVMDALAGEGEYELIFVPWYWQNEYRTRVLPADFKRTAEEVATAALVAKHPDGNKYSHELDDYQLMWRRNKIRELKSGDTFKQEYPFTIREAFLFSGRPAFDVNYLLKAQYQCRLPIAVYEVRMGSGELIPVDVSHFKKATEEENGKEVAKGYKFKDVAGYVQVWAEPVEGVEFCMGADVAEGLEHGDYSAFDINSASGVQVAHFHGHIDPDLFGDFINIVGRHFNNAYVGVERNNHGLVTLKRLEHLDYPNLHTEQELTKEGEAEKYKLGWYTSAVSKPLIIDQLNGELREENSGIQCINTIEQCFTYETDERGRTNARAGCFDDNVMCYAITVEMGRKMPRQLIRTNSATNDNKPRDWRA